VLVSKTHRNDYKIEILAPISHNHLRSYESWEPADKIKGLPGILSTTVGYCGDDSVNGAPSYEKVCSGRTNLVEAVRIEYDPSILSYPELLEIFSSVNTAVRGGSRQYQGIIFVQSEEEATTAKNFLDANEQVVAKIEPMSTKFFKAEKYHQDYWSKFRLRIPIFVSSLLIAGRFGGDMSQTINNIICYGFIAFLLLERRIDNSVDTIVLNDK
jgi:methionine-S-sulfoxide reductase